MPKVTWLGDEDPAAQVITQFGYTFTKGEAVDVSDKDKDALNKLTNNATFSTDSKAEPVASEEPEPVDPDAGTERAALRDQLGARGITLKGNHSVESLRAKLADAVKAENK